MRRVRCTSLTLVLAVLSGGATLATAQDAPAQEPVPAIEAAPKAKPKPKRKPAPKTPAVVPGAEAPLAASEAPAPEAPPAAQAPTFSANLPALTVTCAGRAALYEGARDVSVWVTHTGVIAVENPLRPLTPETTRVIQVVIGGKAATAYGPDLFALRRGGSPSALEAATGGPLRWDVEAVALPDTLNIVSDTGQPVAQLAFQSCGDAPAVQAVAAPKTKAKGNGDKGNGRPKPAAVKAPPGIGLPQGAIPEGARP